MGEPVASVKALYDYKEHRVVLTSSLASQGWLAIWRAARDATEDLDDISSTKVSIPVWAFLSIRLYIRDALRQELVVLELDDQLKDLLQKAEQAEHDLQRSSELQAVPAEQVQGRLAERGFRRVLKNWQRDNVGYIMQLSAAADFSVQGSGKTTEALAFWWLRRNPGDRLVVVAPKNAFAPWEEQVRLCLPESVTVQRLVGSSDQIAEQLATAPDIALINYHRLSQPAVHAKIAAYLASNSVFLFLDESHKIKRGEDGLWGNAALSISHLATAKLILSGTPLPNSESDLVAQFRFLHPEIESDEASVRSQIQPIFVRTTKHDLDIPPLIERLVAVELQPGQRRIYELLCSGIARQADEMLNRRERYAMRTLGRSVLRILKFVSNPALLLPDIQASEAKLLHDVLVEEPSQKLEQAIRLARRFASEGKKSIIWSSFVSNVEVIAGRLRDLGADYIHGGVDTGSDEDDTRERRIRRFHEDARAFVLVANPAAAGEAISLHTVCHNAIYVDRNFNASQFLQSEDRIHRVGLQPTDTTDVYIMHCPQTIDESVERRLREKIRVMGEVLNDPSLNVEPLREDVEDEDIGEADVRDFLGSLQSKV
jgi:SNF2 family DNA or RNA helicase